MKKNKPVKKLRKIPLPFLCYIVFIAGFILYSLFCLVQDSALRAAGKIEQQSLSVEDFVLKDLVLNEDGSLTSTSDDPWLLLESLDTVVRSLRFSAVYSDYPYEINLYYTNKPNEPYSKDKRVWPTLKSEGSYEFVLPRGRINAIRLDVMSAVRTVNISEIVINEKKPFWQFFNLGWAGLFTLVFAPAVFAAALRWVINAVKHYSKKIKNRRQKA